MALLKEMTAHKAHLPEYGKIFERFDAVAVALNRSKALPWQSDGKQCRDRRRLISRSWKQRDAALASSTGREESITERDVLLSDLIEEREGFDEEAAGRRNCEAQHVEGLLRAGEEIRDLALPSRGASKAEPVPDADAGEEESGRRPRFDSDEATASANARAAKKSRNDVYAALMEMEEKKMETDVEEKRAEREFRTKQKETLAKLADAMDQTVAPRPRAESSLGLNGRRIRHHAKVTRLPPFARSVEPARFDTCTLV